MWQQIQKRGSNQAVLNGDLTCDVDAVQRLIIRRKAVAHEGSAVYHAVNPSECLTSAFLVHDVAHNCLHGFSFFVVWTHIQVSAPRRILLPGESVATKLSVYSHEVNPGINHC